METKKVYLYVFDKKENFEKSKTNLGSEGSAFKKIICVEDAIEFENEFALLPESELAFMVVHAFYTDRISGIRRFVASMIGKQSQYYADLWLCDIGTVSNYNELFYLLT